MQLYGHEAHVPRVTLSESLVPAFIPSGIITIPTLSAGLTLNKLSFHIFAYSMYSSHIICLLFW